MNPGELLDLLYRDINGQHARESVCRTGEGARAADRYLGIVVPFCRMDWPHGEGCRVPLFLYGYYMFYIYRKESMMMKKWQVLISALLMGCVFLSGCGSSDTQKSGSKEVEELKIAVSPYQDADTIQTKTEPLGKMLQEKMKEKGYNIKKVTINVGTSYNAVGEALSSGSADMGFISGATYVMYDKDVDVLLTALRQESIRIRRICLYGTTVHPKPSKRI